MKIYMKFLALLLVVALVTCTGITAAYAVEPRNSSNGYTSTNVIYNGKSYTISVGIGTNSSYGVCASAYCPIDGISIYVTGVRAVFDTKYGGYQSKTGSSARGTTAAPSSLSVATPYVYCTNASNLVVLGVNSASSTATFYSVNNGSNVVLNVSFHA